MYIHEFTETHVRYFPLMQVELKKHKQFAVSTNKNQNTTGHFELMDDKLQPKAIQSCEKPFP